MKIDQLLPVMHYGDAVGNDALAIRDIIRSMGYTSDIYVIDHEGSIDSRLSNQKILYVDDFSCNSDDIVIMHFAVSSALTYIIEKLDCRKIMIYHNITPSSFFSKYDSNVYNATKNGLDEVIYLKDKFDYCLADSEFNKKDLISYGYKCDIDVLPVIIPFSDYETKPSEEVLSKYSDDCINLLYVGRIAPNKKIENVIVTYYYYQKHYNKNSRLFLAGSAGGMERYKDRLEKYMTELGVDNVIFTGHIKFDELIAYYKLADVYVCMSEHEGFCVPLVESMYFDLPIVAASHAAVPGTLGGSGILLDKITPPEAAGVVDILVSNQELRNTVIKTQQDRLNDFSYSSVKAKLESYLNKFIREDT